ncbi:endonuclease I family protein [Halobacteriovorax sp.]|uniref:endonuclease I family protein n=1 Tax=Halobacteriovorax sp. TaxID=2020862 RepID=UPI003566BB98
MKKLISISIFILTLNSLALTRDNIVEITKQGHVGLDYSVVKHVLFSTVDNINGVVCSAYTPSQCKERYYKDPTQLSLKKDVQNFKLNIEHTWPQSKGAKEQPANSDMHHLFVTSKESNSMRANLPFCNAEYDYWQMDGSIQGFDQYAQDCFEPQNNHKGNVARAMFYFSIRYNYPIDQDQESVFREWNTLDPVDSRELERNEIIRSLQGNTNPFIENSNLVDFIDNF